MTVTIIPQDQLIRLYRLMEGLNEFFHQPQNFDDIKKVERAAETLYPEIRTFYYDVIWEWLPVDVMESMENS